MTATTTANGVCSTSPISWMHRPPDEAVSKGGDCCGLNIHGHIDLLEFAELQRTFDGA